MIALNKRLYKVQQLSGNHDVDVMTSPGFAGFYSKQIKTTSIPLFESKEYIENTTET